MAVAPWIVSDELWGLVEPLLPKRERRVRYPGRKRLPDRQALQGVLFVLHTGISWTHLPAELGFGSGVTCWRRLDEWQQAGVWERLHELLLARLRTAVKGVKTPVQRGIRILTPFRSIHAGFCQVMRVPTPRGLSRLAAFFTAVRPGCDLGR
jgi:transposase